MRDLRLYDFQRPAIDNIFGSDGNGGIYAEGKRFSNVTLPTGGGKSFVAMRVIQEMTKKFPTEKNIETGLISNLEAEYFAPNTGILYQFRLHMAENLIYNEYAEKYLYPENTITQDNVEQIAKELLGNIIKDVNPPLDYDKSYEMAINKLSSEGEYSPSDIVKEIIKINLKELSPDQLEKNVVNKAFPNLSFRCYQDLSLEKDSKKTNKKLYIFDEIHRGAAKEWIKVLRKLVKINNQAFFLGITATPERNIDEQSLIKDIAMEAGYTPEEFNNKKHYGLDYNLLDAIQNGDVVSPKIVSFLCNLDDSLEYAKVKEKLDEFTKNGYQYMYGKAKGMQYDAMKFIFEQMNQIVGREPKESDQDWQQRKQAIIRDIILSNSDGVPFNQNGKYIAFIPDSGVVDESVGQGLEEGERSKARALANIKMHFERLKDILSQDVQNFEYHTVHSDAVCTKALQEFEKASSIEGGIKTIMTCQKLNEGVHVEDVDGEFLFSEIRAAEAKSKNGKVEISPKINLLQQIGRCIRSKVAEGQKEPAVYDYANNILRHYDTFVSNDGPVFELNPEQIKAREFFNLYELSKMITQKSPTLKGFYGTTINGVSKKVFEFSDGTKIKFPPDENLIKVKQESGKDRFDKVVKVMELLSTVKSTKPIDLKALPRDVVIDDAFFVKYGVSKEEQTRIKTELIKANIFTVGNSSYELGKNLTDIKEVFFGVKSDIGIRNVFKPRDGSKPKYDLPKLAELGIIYLNKDERLLPQFVDVVDINGFIKPSLDILGHAETAEKIDFLDQFIGININTGTRYYLGRDEYGCDEQGYDKLGFDRFGFDKNSVHRLTGKQFDERFFTPVVHEDGSKEWINIFTKTGRDIFGFDHDGIDKNGFEMVKQESKDGLIPTDRPVTYMHHRTNPETGKYSRFRTEYNLETGKNYYGFYKGAKMTEKFYAIRIDGTRSIFAPDGKTENCLSGSSYYDYDGLDIDGFDSKGFKLVNGIWYSRDTGSKYNLLGQDKQGNLEPHVAKSEELIRFVKENPNATEEEITQKFENPDEVLSEGFSRYMLIPYYQQIQPQVANTPIASEWYKVMEANQPAHVMQMIEKLSPSFIKQYNSVTYQTREMLRTIDRNLEQIKEVKAKKQLEGIKKRIETVQTISAENIHDPVFRDYSEEDER